MAMYDWNHNGKNDRQDDYLAVSYTHLLDGQGICFNKEEGKRVPNIDCRR